LRSLGSPVRHDWEVMSDVLRVDPLEITRRVTEILVDRGVPRSEASEQVQVWIEADLREHPSHGVQRLFTMLGRLDNGRVNCAARPSFTWTAPSVLVVDGDDGLGPPVAIDLVTRLMEGARAQGIVIGLVRRAHHLGMLAPYVERMAADGFVGIAMCTSEALVHPWGGSKALVGTNPLAIAVPVAGFPPVSLDMSTGATSRGQILHHAMTGEPLVDGWAVDSDGRPTTDASAALGGAISPFGGPKGYALGVTLEVLIAALTGTAFGQSVTGTLDESEPVTKGDVFLCIDPGNIAGVTMGTELAEYIQQVRSSETAEGASRIYIPGERAHEARQRNLLEGVPIAPELWERILRSCGSEGATEWRPS